MKRDDYIKLASRGINVVIRAATDSDITDADYKAIQKAVAQHYQAAKSDRLAAQRRTTA